MFENSVVRGIFIVKGKVVTGQKRKILNEECNDITAKKYFFG